MKHNLTLVLELALGSGSISLWKDSQLIKLKRPDSKAVRSEDVLAHVDELISTHRYRPENIGCVVCSKGPGSYTGIRVGLATARGLKRALALKVYGYTTTEAMLSMSNPDKKAAAVIDAGRGKFLIWFETSEGIQKYINGLEQIAQIVDNNDLETIIASVGRFEELASALKSNNIRTVDASDNVNRAMFRLFLAEPEMGRDLTPEYGREFMAFGGK